MDILLRHSSSLPVHMPSLFMNRLAWKRETRFSDIWSGITQEVHVVARNRGGQSNDIKTLEDTVSVRYSTDEAPRQGSAQTRGIEQFLIKRANRNHILFLTSRRASGSTRTSNPYLSTFG